MLHFFPWLPHCLAFELNTRNKFLHAIAVKHDDSELFMRFTTENLALLGWTKTAAVKCG